MKKNVLKTIGIIILSTLGVLLLFVAVVGSGNYIQEHFNPLLGSLFMILFPVLLYIGIRIFHKKVNKLPVEATGFGFDKFFKNIFIGAGIAIAIMAVNVLLNIIIFDAKFHFISFKESFLKELIQLSLSLIIVGIWEEFYFRGLVFTTFLRRKFGFHLSALLSSVIFSLIHFQSFDMSETSYFWYLGIIFIGYIMVYIYVLTGSIWSVASFHFLWNFIATLLTPDENKIGLFVVDNMNEISIPFDYVVTSVLGILLLAIITTSRKGKIKRRVELFENKILNANIEQI